MNPQLFVLLLAMDCALFAIAWKMFHPDAILTPQVATAPAAPQLTREYSVGSRDVIYIEVKPGCAAEIRKRHEEGYRQLAEKEGIYVVMVRLNGKQAEGTW